MYNYNREKDDRRFKVYSKYKNYTLDEMLDILAAKEIREPMDKLLDILAEADNQ